MCGRLRMRSLSYFKALEDTRGDQTEGESHLLVPGDVTSVVFNAETASVLGTRSEPGKINFRGSLVQPTYVFCTTLPTADTAYLKARFGAVIVRILDPASFGAALHKSLDRMRLPANRQLRFLDGCRVRYDKGELATDPRLDPNRIRVHFAQKPRAFSLEQEYRFTAVFDGPGQGSPDFIDVELSIPRDAFRLE